MGTVVRTVAIFAMVALTACTTPSGTFCTISDPIRLSPSAVAALSDAEVERILAHNLKGARLCNWKA